MFLFSRSNRSNGLAPQLDVVQPDRGAGRVGLEIDTAASHARSCCRRCRGVGRRKTHLDYEEEEGKTDKERESFHAGASWR